jgi:hypothetical protein
MPAELVGFESAAKMSDAVKAGACSCVTDISALEEGYQEILTGLDRKPYPSLEGMKNIQRLAQSREPRLANIKVESIVDDSLMRTLDSTGFIDRVYGSYGVK